MNPCPRILPALCLLLLCLLPPAAAGETAPFEGETGRIDVIIRGVRPAEGGHIVLLLYRGEENWLIAEKALKRLTVPAGEGGVLTASFPPVPCGSGYAIQVFHDGNDNGTMDFRWLPYPRPAEGAGVSNNHRRLGRPKFEAARFDLKSPIVEIPIDLVY